MKIPKFNFFTNISICFLSSIIQLFIIYKSPTIYIPLFFAVAFSFLYGLIEPKRGWMLAILQILIIIVGFTILKNAGFVPKKPDEAEFASYVLIFPSFVASFLASFLFRK